MLSFLYFCLFVSSAFVAQAQTEAVTATNSAPIVILYESGSNEGDRAFIEMAHAGAKRAQAELGTHSITRSIRPHEVQEDIFRHYAEDGAKLIIALGFQNVATVMAIAKEYPNTSFTIIDGVVPPLFSNVQSIVFRDNEGAFLVGMIAALHSKSHTVGFIGGMDVPIIRNFASGFRQGVVYVDPSATVLENMIGTTPDAWNNPQKAATLSQRQIAQGADIIFAAAGGSSIGVLEKVSHYNNVFGIGVDTNQNSAYPGSVLTSLIKRVDKAVYNAIAQRSDNSWSPGITYMGIAESALDYAVDTHNRTLLSKETVDKVERAKDFITNKLVKVEAYQAK